MNNELLTIDWLGRGWLLLLAFTVAVLLVAALRKPFRRLFGSERAFQLWLLPPLAMLASQLPHTPNLVSTLPLTMVAITSLGSSLPTKVVSAGSIDWRACAALWWLMGMMVSLLLAGVAQRRYRKRLRGATLLTDLPSRWPVLRALDADVGPALVGAWHPRIVLPADFEQRYNRAERTLILAHELAHARRHDGWWCLLAQVAAALCWFHPLAWWALAALRHDQELACDAAVLRVHGEQRRSYATAMLKTQSTAFALPVGCSWSPRHPLTERIAMLKQPSPGRLRQRVGMLSAMAVAMLVTGAAYAASAPQWVHASQQVEGPEYQLHMLVELSTDDGHKVDSETVDLALCAAPGEAAMASVGSLTVHATTLPLKGDQVRMDLAVGNVGAAPLAHSQLQGALGQAVHVSGKAQDGKHAYAIDVTPELGCPARVIAEASPVNVTEHITNGTTRAVAESIAKKAGWTLVNPDALGQGAVTLSFNDMPAGTALQRIAELAGVKMELDGKRVRFEPR